MLGRASLSWSCALALAGAWFVVDARDARACGGCMHPPPGPTEVDGTVVTDHRMVLSLSTVQTVLWDQIRYSGKPSDFAWVLPVKPGARIELSHDEWIASLDAATQTVIQGPQASCYSAPPTEYNGPGNGGGCGSSSYGNGSASPGFAPSADDAGAGDSQVQVVSQEVVGPYDAVTVRSSQGEALGDWLRANGYDVPLAIQPTIDAFSNSGFDFIALRLAPGEGVQAMQPVRVVTPGADPYLPLRMVAAGVGANVGLELYVLSEGRYHVQNFPDATVDFSKLAWDPRASRSNYTQLEADALAANGGRGWLTESSGPVNLYGAGGLNPALYTTYSSTCRAITLPAAPGCGAAPEAGAGTPETGAGPGEGGTATQEAGADAGEAGDGASDASEAGDGGATPVDAGTGGEAGHDAGAGTGADAGACQPAFIPCDDLDVATTGIAFGNLWVTRLRAKLPAAALGADLVLEATPSQEPVTNLHTTSTYTDPSYNPCPANSAGNSSSGSSGSSVGCACKTDDTPRARYADVLVGGLALVAVAGIARRRRRTPAAATRDLR